MRKTLVVAIAAVAAYAGGFYIELGTPSANTEAKAKNAVLIARLTGCHEAEKAKIEGTAEGMVNGKRESIPLKFVPLSIAGMYAVERQWPAEGTWIVRLVGTDAGRHTSVLFKVKGDAFERGGAKFVQRAPTIAEVDDMLKRTE